MLLRGSAVDALGSVESRANGSGCILTETRASLVHARCIIEQTLFATKMYPIYRLQFRSCPF